ncbi:MAG: DUF2442 domain-containing protein [Planctomycetes bacterium]|nr:DUF2442 domain-containing protein [Planctomycetota bacterium]
MAGSEIKPGERVKDVHFGEDSFSVDLIDGRTLSVPYAWYPRLLHATHEQRSNWETCGGGYGIHWPEIDEDLSTEGLLRGAPAPHAAQPVAGRPT